MNFGMVAAVAAGGAIGAVGRYLLATQVGHWFGTGFPWGTFAVNVIGCAIMGVLTELFALAWSPSPELRALLTVGILGGFTTFSAFSLDTILLMERQVWAAALLYVLGSVLLSLAGFFGAMRLMRLVLT
jgi:CrcB protein